MHQGSVTCDKCGKEDALEVANGNSNFKFPKGWVVITPQVHFTKDTAYGLRSKIKEFIKKQMFPSIHLCFECAEPPEEKEKRLAKQKEVDQLTEPPRRVLMTGDQQNVSEIA